MAQRVVTLLIDDLTGEESEDVTNVRFSVAGAEFEIDLNDKHHGEFMEALAPYMKSGRRVKAQQERRRRLCAVLTAGGEDTARIREWAKEQGYEVNDRGRVPASIREAYEKAH